MPTHATILLAEDESAIAETVLYALRAEGYAAEHVLLGGEVLPRLIQVDPEYTFLRAERGQPKVKLLDEGMKLDVLLSPMDKPGPGAVGYVFARTELNITTWVHKRLVDAGVFSNLDWINPQRMPPSFAQDFRIVAVTQDVPRALMLTRNDIDSALQERLREVLMEASTDPDAGEVLRRFIGTSRFVPVSAEDRQALDTLGTGVFRVRTEVE